jgi:hypothetical protein
MTDWPQFGPPGQQPIDLPTEETLVAKWSEERWHCPDHPTRYLNDEIGDMLRCPQDRKFLIKPDQD